MPVEIDRLKARVVRLRRSYQRWVDKRDTLLLRWALEGKAVTNEQRVNLYAWEIASKARQLHEAQRVLKVYGGII